MIATGTKIQVSVKTPHGVIHEFDSREGNKSATCNSSEVLVECDQVTSAQAVDMDHSYTEQAATEVTRQVEVASMARSSKTSSAERSN